MDPKLKVFVEQAAWLYQVPMVSLSVSEYMRLVRKALVLAGEAPDYRADIAYQMASIGENVRQPAQTEKLMDLFQQLKEADGLLRQDQGWKKVAQMVKAGKIE